MERSDAEQKNPLGREWGVRHEGGMVTVHFDGFAFQSRYSANKQRQEYNDSCEWCNGKNHTLAWRSTASPWNSE
jgi:hypothetical protein